MQDRIKNYQNHIENGAWVAENSNVVDGRFLLARAKFNPLIKYAGQVVEAQVREEFYLNSEIVDTSGKPYKQLLNEIAEVDAKKPSDKKRVADLGKVVTHDVPTDCFADDKTIVFLAGGENLANQYGLFLRNQLPEELKIQSVKVYHPSLSNKDFARGVWLYGLDGRSRSDFECDGGDLYNVGGSVFGVSPIREVREAHAPKISESKIRISSIKDILRFSKDYIPSRDWKEFEKGLQERFSGKWK